MGKKDEKMVDTSAEDNGMQVMTPPKDGPSGKRIGILAGVGVALILVLVVVLLLVTRKPSNDDDLAALLNDIPETPVVDEEEVDEDDEDADAMMEEGSDFHSFQLESQSAERPAGVAEVEGYLSFIDMPTTLADEGPTVECTAFTVIDGPDWVLDAYKSDATNYVYDRNFILESIDVTGMNWLGSKDIANGTEDSPIRAVFRIGTPVEAELVGCTDSVELIGTVPEFAEDAEPTE